MAGTHTPDGDTPVPTTELDAPPEGQGESNVSAEEWKAMKSILDTVYDHRTADGHDSSKVFHKKVNKRLIPSYYEVITEPIALSTIKQKINFKTYKEFTEFVRDFALIAHNAQVYNRPDAGAYHDALDVKAVLQRELRKLVDSKLISAETATLPDLGEIPDQDEIPPEENAAAEEEEDDDDEDEEDEGNESDDSRSGKRRGRGRPRKSDKTKLDDGSKDDTQKGDLEGRKKRGRPPRVDTPMEARLKNILKGMRRIRNNAGEFIIGNFDRLPDRAVMPGYYDEIKSPMAIDVVKKKLKRKKYSSVDQFTADVDLIFENAKLFNEDNSQIYKDAELLQREARKLAAQEQQKPDSDFVMEDGRLPLPEGILHNGQLYKVGDWVHIQNANDLTKPIPTQIYRTWQDASGAKFVNVCWYYRPEQTIHRFDKHFFDDEIVKTGQYRDHSIEEIVDRCFVMFITRYNKGRPRNFPRDKEIYVCEARYNEEKHTLNKIKTWASCLPDEVRDKDYEMELYPEAKKMKKHPSPISYLAKDDMKETDELPKPEWGADNAPPRIGAVHKRPRDPRDSLPPEPTPTPPPREPTPPPPPPRQAIQHSDSYSRNQNTTFPTPARQALMTAESQTNVRFPPPRTQSSYQNIASPMPAAPMTSHHSSTNYNARHLSGGDNINYTSKFNLPSSQSYGHGTGTDYKTPQLIEVWSLNDVANASIPPDIRKQFQQDEYGRVLFFTAPPLDTPEVTSVGKDAAPLGHSVSYLAAKAKRDEMVRTHRKRKAEEAVETEERREKAARLELEEIERKVGEVREKALEVWQRQLAEETRVEFRRLYGEAYEVKMKEELVRLGELQRLATA